MKDQQTIKKIGENISICRKNSGLTQQELAGKIGINQPVLASYETGRRSIPVSLLSPISEILEVTVEDILGTEAPKIKKAGPASKLEKQIEKVKKLPRSNQKFVSTFLEQVISTSH